MLIFALESFVSDQEKCFKLLLPSLCDLCAKGRRARQIHPAEGSGFKDSDTSVTAVRLRLCEESAETAASGTRICGEEPQHSTQ